MNKIAKIALAASAVAGLSLGGVVASSGVAEARPDNGFVVKPGNSFKAPQAGNSFKIGNGFRYGNSF